jgi:hypothetical protein
MLSAELMRNSCKQVPVFEDGLEKLLFLKIMSIKGRHGKTIQVCQPSRLRPQRRALSARNLITGLMALRLKLQ